MNEQLRPGSLGMTTQAAEGLVRRRFTVAEIERMVTSGVIAENEHIELIGGEVVPMSPKGARHESIRNELVFQFARQCPAGLRIASETPLTLDADELVEPDLLIHPKRIRLSDVRGDTVLLVVEVADSSLAYDLDTKARVYAAHGVREYWVINAKTLHTRVHREPTQSGYGDVNETPPTERLSPREAPELAVSLGDLELD